MPRTKVPKNSKRNREVANREEKLRLYELKLESKLMEIDTLESKYLALVDEHIKKLQGQLQQELRDMKMPEALLLFQQLDHFSDYKASDQTQLLASSSTVSNTTGGTGTGNRNDEGLFEISNSNSPWKGRGTYAYGLLYSPVL